MAKKPLYNNLLPEKTPNQTISKNMAWLYIFGAGALEIVWAAGFKYDSIPVYVVIIALLLSFNLIIKATKVIAVGTSYAVFAGIGTVGTVIVEIVFGNAEVSILKIGVVLLLLAFIIGLKVTAGKEAQ